jgi:hypothetical protein
MDIANHLRRDNWQNFEMAIRTLTLVMQETEQGSPNLVSRGGQSRGWKIFHYICGRYQVPPHISHSVVQGCLRWE